MKYETKKEAAYALVNGFNHIPYWMMEKMYAFDESLCVLNKYEYSEDEEHYSEYEEAEH